MKAWVALFFILGLLFGSFINVCIWRIPRRQTVVYGSSYCPKCGKKLRMRDLVPVVSYILLKGRCRYCRAIISWRYPVVEILTGIVFALAYYRIGAEMQLLKYLVFFSLLIVIAFIDIDWQLIPDSLVAVILGWGILWQLARPELSWWQCLQGAFVGGGTLLLIALLSNGGMGGGDIKLMFASGLFLGGPQTVLALFLAFLTGAIGGGVLLATGIKKRKDPIPFGPFLALGIVAAAMWGRELIELYFSFL